MNSRPLIKPTPWDEVPLAMPTWELVEYSEDALRQAVKTPGHHTVKVDPLANKRLLHDYGFYYCDTLVKPRCDAARIRAVYHPDATISKEIDTGRLPAICHGAFVQGRFHRDFNLSQSAADRRYDQWLGQLIKAQQVYGLYWQNVLAGFIAYRESSLILHAVSKEYRGKGLAKFWWSTICKAMFEAGHKEVTSSISSSNLAALNLYAALNFSFSEPQDIYHCRVV